MTSNNASLNLSLANVGFTPLDASRFLQALGSLCYETNRAPATYLVDPSKVDIRVFMRTLTGLGVADHDLNRVYEDGCGILFGIWP